jgi:hypothetical protein
MQVTLSPHEMATAAWVGVRRQVEAKRKGLPDKHGFDGDGWGSHIEGAGGEMALAKALGVYWDGGVNTFKRDDLPGIQVRTRSRHDYELLVRSADSGDEVFVLVTGQMPEYRIHGWIRGADAKRAEWEKCHGGRPPAFFVPQGELKPMSTLRRSGCNGEA